MPRGSATTPAIPMPTPGGAGYSFFLDFDGTIAQLDALLAPLQLPMAGLHGLERRDSLGEPQHSVVDTAWIAAGRRQLRLHVDAHPGLLLEDEGTAIHAFMSETPFAGKKPLFIGDDISDRPAIAAVIRLGGTAICVGDRIVAPWRLPTPAAVRQWLADFVAAGGSQ